MLTRPTFAECFSEFINQGKLDLAGSGRMNFVNDFLPQNKNTLLLYTSYILIKWLVRIKLSKNNINNSVECEHITRCHVYENSLQVSSPYLPIKFFSHITPGEEKSERLYNHLWSCLLIYREYWSKTAPFRRRYQTTDLPDCGHHR